MSIFFKSFKREIGKNSGKWLSNIVFKDKHSTPIKIIREQKNVELNQQKQEFKEKIKFEEKLVELEQKKFLNNKTNLLAEKRNSVLEMELPNDKNELFNFALNLITEIKSNRWSSNNSDEEETSNEYLEAHYQKLKQVKTKLQFINATIEVEHVNKELKKIRNRRFAQKYWVYFVLIIVFAYLFLKSM